MTAKLPEIHEQVCAKCGTNVSGPDAKAVKSTMTRHTKAKHPTKRKAKAKK
jgi:hypothetical protein